jgi:hypothetical protein
MVHLCIKRQQQRWTLTHDPHARLTTAMPPTLVAFGAFAPTLQVPMVGWHLGGLATHQQAGRKAAHPLGDVLLKGGCA